MSPVDGERVVVEANDGIAAVRLKRPAKHNALDFRMFEAISAAIDEVAAAPGVRAVVLSGEGPSFCSGLDFPSFAAEERPVDSMFERRAGEDANLAQRVSIGWQALPVPVICAITGACIGGGAQIALGADLRTIAPDARISIREAHWGLIPDMGITRTLPRLVRMDVAKDLVMTARMLDGAEAVRLGLATRLAEDPLAAAHELAAEIASRSPDAVRRGKSLLERSWTMDAAGSLALEEELQRELLGSSNQIKAAIAGMSGEAAEFDDSTWSG